MDIVNVGYDSTNYYVLGQGANRLLVDVGFPGTLPKLMAALKRKDVAFGALRYLLATHYHPDHAGLAQELKGQGVRLVVLDCQRAAIPLLKTHMKPEQHYVAITLHDNLDLTLAASRAWLAGLGIAGEIIATPGHSDDSVTLVLDEGAAFTGDLTHPALVDATSGAAVLASWERIRGLKARRIYPGHGPVQALAAADAS